MRRAIFLATVLAAFCAAQAARAQPEPASVDALRETVELLTLRVQEMESAREADRHRMRELEDRIAQLAATSAGSAAEREPEVLLGGTAAIGQGNLLNPQITGFIDTGGSLSSDGDNKARNRFNLREAELDLRGAVSPRADGVLILAMGEEIEDPFGDVDVSIEFEVEEAYLNVHTLPRDLALKAGKFRSAFGRNNLLHTHDLPQVTRPLAVQAFLGPEGLATLGASLDWIVPNPWDRYVELTTQLVNADGGSESPILGGPDAVNPAVLSHLKLFQDVGDTGSLELGASFLHTRTSGDRDAAGYVLGADATYHWRDPAQPDFRSLLLQGELFWSNSDFDDEIRGIIHDDNWGFYLFGQYQLGQNWYAGVRYDYTDFPNLEVRRRTDSDWGISSYVTWYLNEALRLRLEYQHLERELLGQSDHEDSLLLGLTFYIGAHPPHPYWVNR
jgi:hypothetical protein